MFSYPGERNQKKQHSTKHTHSVLRPSKKQMKNKTNGWIFLLYLIPLHYPLWKINCRDRKYWLAASGIHPGWHAPRPLPCVYREMAFVLHIRRRDKKLWLFHSNPELDVAKMFHMFMNAITTQRRRHTHTRHDSAWARRGRREYVKMIWVAWWCSYTLLAWPGLGKGLRCGCRPPRWTRAQQFHSFCEDDMMQQKQKQQLQSAAMLFHLHAPLCMGLAVGYYSTT